MAGSATSVRFKRSTEMRSPGSGGPSSSPKKVSQAVSDIDAAMSAVIARRLRMAILSFQSRQYLGGPLAQGRRCIQVVGEAGEDLPGLGRVAVAVGEDGGDLPRRIAPGIAGFGQRLQPLGQY